MSNNAVRQRESTSKRFLPFRKLSQIPPNVDPYDAELLPLIMEGYYPNKENDTIIPLSLRHSLNVPIVTIKNLKLKPGEDHFVIWFFISSYFPILSACLGPLANMISIVSLLEHWRYDTVTLKQIPDRPAFMVLNALSLGMGIIGNVSLLMNFSGTIRYLVTQTVSIFCWFLASLLLAIDLILTNNEIRNTVHVARTDGFWFAAFTSFFYFVCSVILSINFLGYKLNKYPPTFNLNPKQRSLMIYIIGFAIWTTVGTVSVRHLIKGLTYGSALYFCIVSFLTIGFGDIVPKSSLAKAMVLFFSLGGVLMMGLIIAMIRQVVLTSGGPTMFWNLIEKRRAKELQSIEDNAQKITSEEAYDKIRAIRRSAKMRQLNLSLLFTLGNFMVFWLVGALVFLYVEGWTYFNGVYFCFLCLITIGYGDYVPVTPLGRSFFVCWAVSAVPLMTILISNMGDKLFDFADQTSFFITKWLSISYRSKHKSIRDDVKHKNIQEIKPTTSLESEVPRPKILAEEWPQHKRFIEKKLQIHRETNYRILGFLEELKPIISDLLDNPSKIYSHEQWSKILNLLEVESSLMPANEETSEDTSLFWLSDVSPLRLPLKEPHYMFVKIFLKIEQDLRYLMNMELQDIQFLDEELLSEVSSEEDLTGDGSSASWSQQYKEKLNREDNFKIDSVNEDFTERNTRKLTRNVTSPSLNQKYKSGRKLTRTLTDPNFSGRFSTSNFPNDRFRN